ncbi:MAG: hypothetical protein PHP46_02030 [Candidatus Omnitrophica bacterium]|nr:hypothetical protein [Candidatus Omnitrophota bacterium]
MNPDIFEVIMLVCFGAAWPFSIYKMVKTKKSHGKSVYFLAVILAGYISGILFEYFGERNDVMLLYLLNTFMVSLDITLTVKYGRKYA